QNGMTIGRVDLDSIARQTHVGDPILFQDPSPTPSNDPRLVSVISYTEVIYYANNPSNPLQPPLPPSASGATPQPAIPIPHTQLTFTPALTSNWDTTLVQVDYAWKVVGQMIDTPAVTVGGTDGGTGPGSGTATA